MIRSLISLLGIALLAWAGWLALLYVQQRSMMFPGAGAGWPGVGAALPPHGEKVTLPASFGTAEAVFLPAHGVDGRAPAALYFHGNYEFVDQNLELLDRVAALGLHVLLVEYPGYAGTDGRPTRATLNEAARLGYDWLAAHPDVVAERILAIGRSVGSGPALDLAAARRLAAVVLLAPFTSVADFARRYGAPAFLVRDRYDNRARIRAYDGPVLLFHGRADGVVSFAHSEALAGMASRATLVPLECGHNDCPHFDPDWLARLQQFLAAEGILAPEPPADESQTAGVTPSI
jgi:hypothetical protein